MARTSFAFGVLGNVVFLSKVKVIDLPQKEVR